MKTVPRIRILVTDDHVSVREGLVAIISRQSDMEVVGEAANGRVAVDQWQTLRPDVLVIDVRMPLLNGIKAIEEIRALDPNARALVLTTFDTDDEISQVIKAGARAYLLKDAPREELLDCIRRVHAGETCIPPAVVAKLVAGLTSQALTSRELVVLELLAKGRSNRDISAELHIGETTVKSHLRNIFSKLQAISRSEAISIAMRRGLVRI